MVTSAGVRCSRCKACDRHERDRAENEYRDHACGDQKLAREARYLGALLRRRSTGACRVDDSAELRACRRINEEDDTTGQKPQEPAERVVERGAGHRAARHLAESAPI